MLCPACKTAEMHEVSKQGVLIDVCPQCRGVWLERGELEKILSAGRSFYPDYDETYGEKKRNRYPEDARHDHDHNEHDYKHKKHHKKKSFFNMLEDIFD